MPEDSHDRLVCDWLAVGAGVEPEVVESSQCREPFEVVRGLKAPGRVGENELLVRILPAVPGDAFEILAIGDRPRFDDVQGDDPALFMGHLHQGFGEEGLDARLPRGLTGGKRVVALQPVQAQAADFLPDPLGVIARLHEEFAAKPWVEGGLLGDEGVHAVAAARLIGHGEAEEEGGVFATGVEVGEEGEVLGRPDPLFIPGELEGDIPGPPEVTMGVEDAVGEKPGQFPLEEGVVFGALQRTGDGRETTGRCGHRRTTAEEGVGIGRTANSTWCGGLSQPRGTGAILEGTATP